MYLVIITIGKFNSHKGKGTISAPIFMDNVACYGSEDKLIDCTYHTDTSEDEHVNDIWINCDGTVSEKSSSLVAMVISLIALGISILVTFFLIGHLLHRHKTKPYSNACCR